MKVNVLIKVTLLFFFSSLMISCSNRTASPKLEDGFVYIKDIIPTIELEIRYYGKHNFIGKPIDGYLKHTAILSREAAFALAKVQVELNQQQMGLKIFDSYRPQRAVNHFIRWAEDSNDIKMKQEFYPGVNKENLFAKGYISKRSGHTRGSTLDLTIVKLNPDGSSTELDMGYPYDFFGSESWLVYDNITPEQKQNRLLLNSVMLKHGFKAYDKEWWHFTLANEPYPETYFDFPVQ